MSSTSRLLLFTLLLCCFTTSLSAQTVKGKLGYVIDGDSFYMTQENGRALRVRIYGIDSPENDQAYGSESKEFLNNYLKDKSLTLSPTGTDKLGRTEGVVTVGDKDLAEEMLRNGCSWHYKKYSQDSKLAQLETEAKAKKIGLWKDPAAMAPWKFRDQQGN
jgi:micrococcal nuclease